ncbi:MAG TPA: glycosyltransferase [Chromatiaceae bacterium]|jgi:glycosyltransferase involved in cell wall biosynthesis|nr:MAG: hypothetical protein N838_00875 [Thiohalocapsa sp. PB-PSB1]QQO57414.1 MAG: glycosyltransferase [Thiohalocapsa sp. PB-PSB1]HBG97098.1 glycosyltransferase [Chromatiaceae bacterium]HCS92617.1 glycosyltransferase [Chromatiaceae bacterium]
MHLLILHQASVFGGAERTTRNLLEMLDRSVVQRISFAAPDALRDLMPVAYDDYVNTANLIRHGYFVSPESLEQDIEATARLLGEAGADVALGMMHYSAALVVKATANAGLSTKTIASFRGPTSEYLSRYEQGTERIAFLRHTIADTSRLADRILVPSQGTADDTCTHFGAPRDRTIVIPNGIDAAAVRSASLSPATGLESLDSALPLLCVAARLSVEKELELLIHAMRLVQRTRACTLVVVGDGPERANLEQQVAESGLTDHVVFVGHRQNVYPYIHKADLYVHTCQFEGFGYAMLEAMACGTPVVATDCPHGPRDVLADGACGVLVPPADPNALATAIVQLLADDERRVELTEAGKQRADELSVERMVSSYQAVLSALVPERGA